MLKKLLPFYCFFVINKYKDVNLDFLFRSVPLVIDLAI